ncbi:hypothetical protein O7635_22370 [Asanoa sp. WMMD1127]|uniref:hypothetical protein n=1 Tax=Asanoa sp. WMMD1127 TaxID=3016107 RepID=UPI0024176FF9|nr:hypothetical protein [Asanoa sp. WMMD1127]MDG4824604.1 hypothetical protein [Asanoa sp. WMMD1127]
MYRSADGGRTWDEGTDVPLPSGRTRMFGTADGTAYLSASEKLWRVDARSLGQVRDGPRPYARILPVPGGGYLATGLKPEVGLWLSTDGRSWSQLDTPVLRR